MSANEFKDLSGCRVAIDMTRARMSLPKGQDGQLTQQGVRLARVLEEVVDGAGQRPFITADYGNEVEISTNYFGEGMKSIRLPKQSVALEEVQPSDTSRRKEFGMLVFEVTARGFDSSSDDTDDRVFWILAQDAGVVSSAIEGTEATLQGVVDCAPHPDDINFRLPDQLGQLRDALTHFDVEKPRERAS